jgi:hypothetical protein
MMTDETTETAEMGDESAIFDRIAAAPVPAAAPNLPGSGGLGPVEYRDSGTQPLHVSSFDGSRDFRSEFMVGARSLGLDTPQKRIPPQTLVIADALNATGADGLARFSTVAVCVPRRASKTTSIFASLLGRCFERPGYEVAYSAQTGMKARDRFMLDVVRPLERTFPDDGTRPFKINRGRGSEQVIWDNGSRFVVLAPIADNFRGDAFDAVVLDEAQVHDPEASEDLLGAILPTFDTRPGAQLIVAGTTGEHRSGMLWATLEDGRRGRADTGVVEYGAGDSVTEEEHGDPEVWQRSHPGIGNLTPLTVIRRNFEKLPRAQFLREYLGVWPAGGAGRFLNPQRWAESAIPGELPAPPDHFSVAFQVHPDGLSASIVAAWRDSQGNAHIGILDHRPGTEWLAPAALSIARKHRTPLVHDTYGGPNNVQVEALQRARPRPRFEPQTMADVKTAAALLVKELDDGKLRHYAQDEMDEAARLAVKRRIGNGWGLGRGTDADEDITPLEAAALALRAYDGSKRRAPFQPLMAN